MIPWKGVALWKSARNGHKAWFVALLLINTLAILDVVYIVFFSGENKIEKQELVAGNNNTKRLIV
jgi:methionyl-tRNA synthetase